MPPIRSSPTDGRTDSFSPSCRNLFILGDFNCHHPLCDSRVTSDPRGEEVFNWVISSDLLPLNDPDTHPPFSIAPLAVAPLLTSPFLLLLLPFLAPGGFRTWVLTIYQFFYLSSLSGLSPQPASPFVQFSESLLGWLCLSLSFSRGILVSFSFLCCCSSYLVDFECGQILHSFRPHQTPSYSLVVC